VRAGRRIDVPNKKAGKVHDGRWIPRADYITLMPAIPEWEDCDENWLELFGALSDQGFKVQIPKNKIAPSGADLPEFIPMAFVVYVGYKLTDALVDRLFNELTSKIIERVGSGYWRKRPKAKGVIYGPDGEVLKELIYESKQPDD
jgi:hypothetical protein